MIWGAKLKVPSREKLVLMLMGNYANARAECWPSYSTLAASCAVSVGTVKRALKQLEEWGLVEVENRFHPNGKPRSNRYTLRLDRAAPPDALDGSTETPTPEDEEENDEETTTSEGHERGTVQPDSIGRSHGESIPRTHTDTNVGVTETPTNRNNQLEPSPLNPPRPSPVASAAPAPAPATALPDGEAAGSAGQENATGDPNSEAFIRDQFNQLVGFWQQANLLRFAGDQTSAWKYFREMPLVDRLEAVTKAHLYLLGAKAAYAEWSSKDRKDRSRQPPKAATIKEYLGTRVFKLTGMPKEPPAPPKPISAAWVNAIKSASRSQFDEGAFFAAHDSEQFAAWIAAERRAGINPVGARDFQKRDVSQDDPALRHGDPPPMHPIIWRGRGRFFVSEWPPREEDFQNIEQDRGAA